jgi:5'-methylthioinosine phosphorylase
VIAANNFLIEKSCMIETAIIGGSGLSIFAGAECVNEIALVTPYGPTSAPLQILLKGDARFAFIARHGRPHRIPPHRINYRANLWVLREQGVRTVIAVNAVGGISVPTGAVIIPQQIIDYTYGREHTYYDGLGYGSQGCDANDVALEHVDFSLPYSEKLRKRLLQAATRVGVTVIDGGVYGATQGPRLEAAAEIERLQRDGCTIVGMTGMPEAALARELALSYAAICLVVNPAAGRGNEPITMAQMQTAMANGMLDVQKIVEAALIG